MVVYEYMTNHTLIVNDENDYDALILHLSELKLLKLNFYTNEINS